ncbi:MAG: hypothetical protein ACJ76Q_18115, partial [Solirubrobacteraceae bacterium]
MIIGRLMAAAASRTAEHGSAAEHNVPVPLTSLIGRSSELLNMAGEPAQADLEAARTLHRRAGSRAGEGLAIATLGLTFLMTGEPDRARELLDEAVAIQTAAGYLWGEGHA